MITNSAAARDIRHLVHGFVELNAQRERGPTVITGGKGKAEDKIRTLQECGVTVSTSPTRMGEAMAEALKK